MGLEKALVLRCHLQVGINLLQQKGGPKLRLGTNIPGAWRKLYETMVLDFLSSRDFVLQLEAYGDDLVDG